jgi:hypothetical protein
MKSTAKKGVKSTPDEELEVLAHHLAEVLRITRTHPDIPAHLYMKTQLSTLRTKGGKR